MEVRRIYMQEQMQINKVDIGIMIGDLERTGKYSDDQIQLIREDLLYGLSKESIERYTQKKYDLKQMQVFSKCLRNNYPEEVIAAITANGLSWQQMEVAFEFYEKGISIETISKVASGDVTAANMKRTYQRVLNEMEKSITNDDAHEPYVKQLMEQIKAVVDKLEFQEHRYDSLNQKLRGMEIAKKNSEEEIKLRKELAEKDALLIEQQNKQNNLHATVVKLQNDCEVLRKEKGEMEKILNEVRINNQQREFGDAKKDVVVTGLEAGRRLEPVEPMPLYYGMPIGYSLCVMNGNTVIIPVVPIEKTVRKTSGTIGIFSRLLLKKKSRQDLIKLITAKELTPGQLLQIKSAIEKGLDEDQLQELIQNKVSAEQMEIIIDIATMQNSRGELRG
jgi:hypothetical protein